MQTNATKTAETMYDSSQNRVVIGSKFQNSISIINCSNCGFSSKCDAVTKKHPFHTKPKRQLKHGVQENNTRMKT